MQEEDLGSIEKVHPPSGSHGVIDDCPKGLYQSDYGGKTFKWKKILLLGCCSNMCECINTQHCAKLKYMTRNGSSITTPRLLTWSPMHYAQSVSQLSSHVFHLGPTWATLSTWLYRVESQQFLTPSQAASSLVMRVCTQFNSWSLTHG